MFFILLQQTDSRHDHSEPRLNVFGVELRGNIRILR
jgi:hypothetical protein